LSRSKTEYLHYRFSAGKGGVVDEVSMEGAESRIERFRYLGLIIEGNGKIDEDINQRINIRWQKWKNASGVLYGKKIPLRLNGRVYRMIVRPILLYGAECRPIKKS